MPAWPPSWWRVALRDIWRDIWLKAAGAAVYMTAYFYFYFLLLRDPPRPVTLFAPTALDRLLPFQPWAFWPYITLWAYVCLPAALQPTLPTLLRHALAAAALCAAGIGFYYFLPSAFSHMEAPWPPGHAGAFLGQMDLARNVFPSMHVAFTCFGAIWMNTMLTLLRAPRAARLASAVWCALIIYSTMAIKQHIVWDVMAGMALGLAWGGLSARWARPSLERARRRIEPAR
jgi:membrane-associated phospholipid phosphatase